MKYATLAVAQIAVGAAAIFARFALTGAQPIAVAASRLAIASIVLLAIAGLERLRNRSNAPSTSPSDNRIFIAAGLALAVHFAGWIWSLEYTSVAISTLLVATTPVWTALYDSIVNKRRLSAAAWGALVSGIVGLILVVGFSTTRAPIPGHEVVGGMLALAGGVAFAAYFLLVRHVRDTYGTRATVTRTYTWAAIALIIVSVFARQSPPALHNTQAWGGILAMALVSQLMGHTALNAALRWFSASAVALTTLLEPVTAAVLALIILGERLTPTALAGGALILTAIATFLREETRWSAPDRELAPSICKEMDGSS